MSKKIVEKHKHFSFLTPRQSSELLKAGYESLYSIIINFPYRYETVELLDGAFVEQKKLYFLIGSVVSIQRKNSFYIVSIRSHNSDIVYDCYYFVRSAYVVNAFPPQCVVQVELNRIKSFYTIKRIALQKNEYTGNVKNPSSYPLGKKPYQPYIIPYYSKQNTLTTYEWMKIHDRIPDSAYILNLEGLVPHNATSYKLPARLDLKEVHKPYNLLQTAEIIQNYRLFKIFLKLAYNRQLEEFAQNKCGQAITKDAEFLTQLSSCVPFNLSASQKHVIWDIISCFDQSSVLRETPQQHD